MEVKYTMVKTWWKEAVVYQIYPRSFMDSNGDGVGDIRGIISRLDYLKELGIDVIWLSPCYKSPNVDNGYDISDYKDIMNEFGTMDDFKEMLKEIHSRGMRLLMDLVVNHTSDQHPWFVEARKSVNNPYREYYIWNDPKEGKEPNNWTSYFSGSAWSLDEITGQYYLHLFTKNQPDLNWENEKLRHEIYDIMKFWLDMGCDGFRMDVANLYSKVPGFPDGVPRVGRIGAEHYQNGPRIHEFFQEMNREVLSKYDIMTVGEMSDVSLEEAVRYAGNDAGELNMVFQFEHDDLDTVDGERWAYRRVPLSELKTVFSKWQNGMNGKAWNSLYWTNHDQPRTVSRRGNDGKYRKESQKMLYTMLLTMQGTPFIYQGEEIGMTNAYFDSIDEYDDVEIHNCWRERVIKAGEDPDKLFDGIRFRARDNARTPMQWDDTENAGFTKGKSWIQVNKNYKKINVKEALEDPKSIFYYMQKLIKIRKQNEISVYGDFFEYEPENEQLYIYERNYKNQTMAVILNFSEEEAIFNLPDKWQRLEFGILISNYPNQQLQNRKIQPYEASVYLSK